TKNSVIKKVSRKWLLKRENKIKKNKNKIKYRLENADFSLLQLNRYQIHSNTNKRDKYNMNKDLWHQGGSLLLASDEKKEKEDLEHKNGKETQKRWSGMMVMENKNSNMGYFNRSMNKNDCKYFSHKPGNNYAYYHMTFRRGMSTQQHLPQDKDKSKPVWYSNLLTLKFLKISVLFFFFNF
ncbi:hypothetical protein RFI_15233, partial [Reticulomyxa filosa]